MASAVEAHNASFIEEKARQNSQPRHGSIGESAQRLTGSLDPRVPLRRIIERRNAIQSAGIVIRQLAIPNILEELLPDATIVATDHSSEPFFKKTSVIFDPKAGPWADSPYITSAREIEIQVFPDGQHEVFSSTGGEGLTRMSTRWDINGPAFPTYSIMSVKEQIVLAITHAQPNLQHAQPKVSLKEYVLGEIALTTRQLKQVTRDTLSLIWEGIQQL